MTRKTASPEVTSASQTADLLHRRLPSGVEVAADLLPDRHTVALVFRVLAGLAEEPTELAGIGAIVERTLSKGTQNYTGQQLADAFDRYGVQWSTAAGRQSMMARLLCLPEFVEPAVELVAELLRRPTFPEEACDVAVRLAQEQLAHLEDDPSELVRAMIQRQTLGETLGRRVLGQAETLQRITQRHMREHWQRCYHAGRIQVALAGPVDPARLVDALDRCFAGFGSAEPAGREPAAVSAQERRAHRHKELQQQYIAMTLPGAPKGHADYATEQVLLGVLSGGMSGRLFTEVREKLGLVYWVAAWHEHLRGVGTIHLGASTTPERCDQTYTTLLRELERVGTDLTDEETSRARNQIVAHSLTEDDLTRARASGLSDDLFHFGRPIGLEPKLAAVRRVSRADVEAYVRRLPLDQLRAATIGPRELSV